MPLTRPKASQLSTATFNIDDPLIEINKSLAGANTNDLGIIINRGTSGNNVGIIWDRTAQSFVLAETTADGSATGDIALTAYSDLQVKDLTANSLTMTNYAFPIADGANGQVLKTNGFGIVTWQAESGGSAVFTDSYDSGNQTITAAGSLTLAHSLGAKPKLVQCILKCTTAEDGYSIGDEVIINAGIVGDDETVSRGVSVVPDATNLNIRFGSATNTFMVLNKSSGGRESITNSNWAIIFKAWV